MERGVLNEGAVRQSDTETRGSAPRLEWDADPAAVAGILVDLD